MLYFLSVQYIFPNLSKQKAPALLTVSKEKGHALLNVVRNKSDFLRKQEMTVFLAEELCGRLTVQLHWGLTPHPAHIPSLNP